MDLYFDSQKVLSCSLILFCCFRLNGKEKWEMRKKYIDKIIERFPENLRLKQLRVKSLIDLNEFVEAETILEELMGENPMRGEFVQGDLYFAQKNYIAAINSYCKFKLTDYFHFWRAQYDYKMATAYFKTNQLEKWKKKAIGIGRRLAWDKFYTIDFLENEGVERIPEIDEVIIASKNPKRWIYPDMLFLILKRTPRVLLELFLIYRYAIVFYLAGILFIGMLIRAFLKYL